MAVMASSVLGDNCSGWIMVEDDASSDVLADGATPWTTASAEASYVAIGRGVVNGLSRRGVLFPGSTFSLLLVDRLPGVSPRSC